MRRAALYLCYYNITEPLVQTQVVAYLRELAQHGFEIHLLTFEKEQLDPSQRDRIRDTLRSAGITWYALRYHSWPSLPATFFDIVRGAVKALSVCVKSEIRIVHGRSHVGATVALIVKRLYGARMIFDMRGLLAEEYADAGRWASTGVKYRVTKATERMLFRNADAVVMLTQKIKKALVATEPSLERRAGEIEVIPCCTDANRFERGRAQRAVERERRGWEGKRVLIYVGKLGPWYPAEAMVRFLSVAREQNRRWFFQVLTQSDPRPMKRALQDARVPLEAYAIDSVEPEQTPVVLGAADAGISFLSRPYSKQACSPTKVAEYLAAGLPVVSTPGIGDCDEILASGKLGVLVETLDEVGYGRAARALTALLEDPDTPSVCQEFARRELSLEAVGGPRYARVYSRLLTDAVEARVVGPWR